MSSTITVTKRITKQPKQPKQPKQLDQLEFERLKTFYSSRIEEIELEKQELERLQTFYSSKIKEITTMFNKGQIEEVLIDSLQV